MADGMFLAPGEGDESSEWTPVTVCKGTLRSIVDGVVTVAQPGGKMASVCMASDIRIVEI
jgi:hypothetical protein